MANSRLVDPADPTGNFKATLRLTRTVTPLGTSADAARIQAALTAMAAVGGRVILKAGTYTVTSAVTGASNVVVEFMPGAVLSVSTGILVTFASPVVAPGSRIFSGAGQVYTSPDQPFDPRWWGRPSSFGGDASSVLHLSFDKPGAHATLYGLRGEIVRVTRSTTATVIVNGAEVTAAANEARVDEEGLLIEPAATNALLDPTNLASANWTPSNYSAPTAAADPLGGTTAFEFRETAVNAGHMVYQLVTAPASAQTLSFYIMPIGGRTVVRLSTNSALEFAVFTLEGAGTVNSITGATTRGEIEYVGLGWYRISMRWAAATALVNVGAGNSPASFTFLGEVSKGFRLWRPQWEANEYATSWTATTRAAESCVVSCPNFGSEWAIEVLATPLGAQRWDRGTEHPLLSIGTYHAANSIECYVAGGAPVCSVYNAATAELKQTGPALAAANNYLGSRYLCFASVGLQRPAVFLDGRQFTGTASGAGNGLFSGAAIGVLNLGYASTIYGGFRIREVRVANQARPPSRPRGAYSYAWAFTRGYCTRANTIAFLGDSNTQGIYDVSITTPYPQGAITAKGTSYQAHNFGIGSNGSQQALDRLRADILGRGYTKMVLWIGINDVNLGVKTDVTIANITKILDEAAADGITVYPITVLPGANPATTPLIQTINTAIAALAAARGLTVVDAYALFNSAGAINATYDIDGGSLHLNQAGQTLLAASVAAVL